MRGFRIEVKDLTIEELIPGTASIAAVDPPAIAATNAATEDEGSPAFVAALPMSPGRDLAFH